MYLLVYFCIALGWPLAFDQFAASAHAVGLYKPTDGVTLLDSKNFEQHIYNKPWLNFVLFYSSHCGHCIEFAPKWKGLATKIRGWAPAVKVAAIDCGEKDNFDKCSEHDIEAYPMLKIFPPNSVSKDNGNLVERNDLNSADRLSFFIAHEAGQLYRKHHYQQWPNLDYISEGEITHSLNEEENRNVRYAIVIFQNAQNDTLGEWTMLQSIPHSNQIAVRISTSNNSARPLPALIIYDVQDKWKIIFESKVVQSASSIVEAVKMYCNLKLVETVHASPAQNAPEERQSREEFHVEDIRSALSQLFEYEIPVKKLISGEELEVLKQFLGVLNKYFPSNSRGVHEMLGALKSWVDQRNDSITSKEWKNKIDELKKVHSFPSNIEWRTCKGSAPQYRKYPCGLWMTFHALTVSAYKMDGLNPDFSPIDVLQAISGYVRTFFTCRECAQNFGKAAVKIPEQVRRSEDVVLWLWKSHNRANKFLKGQPSEDPTHLKYQFPSTSMCPKCHDESGDWFELEVLNFLLNFYSMDGQMEADRVNPKLRPLLAAKDKLSSTDQEEVGKSKGNWYPSHPLSICFLVWVVCSLMAVGLFLIARFMKSRFFMKSILGYRTI